MSALRPNTATAPGLTTRPRRLNKGMIFIVCGVLTALLTLIVISSMTASRAPVKDHVVAAKTRPLVVASQPLLAGETIAPGSVKIVDWPADHYPDANVQVFQTTDGLLGRVVKKDVFPGEPVNALSLDSTASTGGLPVVIPNGYRAITILVTENKGVAGFIKPGNRVDVIGSFEYRIPEVSQRKMADKTGYVTQDALQITQTVLQDVSVLAIAQQMVDGSSQNSAGQNANSPAAGNNKAQASNATPPAGSGDHASGSPTAATPPGQDDPTKGKVVSSVTLAVTPEQAEKLAFADERGSLRLILRPESDHSNVALLGAVTEDVVPLKKLYEKALQVQNDAASIPGFNSKPRHTGLSLSKTPGFSSRKMRPVYAPGTSGPAQVEIIQGDSRSVMAF